MDSVGVAGWRGISGVVLTKLSFLAITSKTGDVISALLLLSNHSCFMYPYRIKLVSEFGMCDSKVAESGDLPSTGTVVTCDPQ